MTILVYLQQELQQKYDKILAQEKIHWYQKAKDDWIKFGNQNTKVFHTKMISRRKRNKVYDLHFLKEESLTFFKGLFYSASPIIPSSIPDPYMVLVLTKEFQHSLTQQMTREEVTYALNQMHAFMVPDPDGF